MVILWKIFQFPKKEQSLIVKKENKLLVLIDHDNIDGHLRGHGLRLDFSGLMRELLKIGKVKHTLLFIPFGSYHGLPSDINNLGYEIIVCQKMDISGDSEKREDKVDSRMALMAKNFLDYSEITHVVILTHDKHSIEVSSEIVKEGKTPIYFAIENEMAGELREFIKKYRIKVNPLPKKARATMF